jgi:ATP-dependent Clp protease ATP-binding subunit ClpX
MLDVMYDLPSLSGVRECVITEESVRGDAKPMLIHDSP